MRIFSRTNLFVMVLSFTITAINAQQKFKATTTSVIGYLEYLPQDYHTNSDPYPIVIFLHGLGERGATSVDTTVLKGSIDKVTRHGPPKYVKNGNQFPFILISPQLKSEFGGWSNNYIMEVINHCKTYLRIDERRIYLTGLSLGGGGTWGAAQGYPELFAAIAPVCGASNSPSKACSLAAENLPVWAFHGDKDTTVPLSKSQTMVNAINACIPLPSPLAKLTIYLGVYHNSWDKAYTIDHSVQNPNVYEWLMSFTNTHNKGNKTPVANAGADKTTALTSTTLTGSGTDEDGSITSYLWSQLSGPAITFTNVTSASLPLTGLIPGQYVFRLKVTDNSGNTNSDYVKLTVEEASKNIAPVAKAGADKTITLPTNSITITGSGSDADGTISSYQWTKVSGGSITLAGATTPNLQVSNVVAGYYVLQLTVTDNHGATHSDKMGLKVNPAPARPAITVNAGEDQVVKLPMDYATLTATATGTIASYAWTKISGGSCTMSNVTTASMRARSLVSGVYVFRVTATDTDGKTASDDVTVIVDAPPVVNAGPDITVTLPVTSLVVKGTATDPDGSIVRYQWSKYSGPNVVIQDSTVPSMVITKLYEGVYVFKLSAYDEYGAKGTAAVTITVKGSTATLSKTPVSTGK